MKRIFFIVVLLCFTFICNAQSYVELCQKYKENQEAQKYDAAYEVATQITSKYIKELAKEPVLLADINNTYGNHYYNLNQFDSSYMCYSRAVNGMYLLSGDTSFDYAFYLHNAAYVLSTVGSYELAEKYYLGALPGLAKHLGPTSLDYTILYKGYVDMKIEKGDYEQASPLNEALIFYFKSVKGETDKYYINCLNNKARIYQGTGNYEAAIPVFMQILNLQTQYHSNDTGNVATIYNNTAECYRQAGKFKEAEPYYLEALRLEELLKTHIDAQASIYNNLGLLYKSQSNYPKSELAFAKSIKLYQSINSSGTVEISNPYNNISDLYRLTRNLDKGIEYASMAVQIRKVLTGEDNESYANAYTNLGLLYYEKGMYDEAEKIFLKSQEIYKKVLGESHPRYANCISILSSLSQTKGDFVKARKYLDESLRLMERTTGKNTDKYAYALNSLAMLLINEKQYQQAIDSYDKAANIFEQNFGKENFNYLDMIYNKAFAQFCKSDWEGAKLSYMSIMGNYRKLIQDNFEIMTEEERAAFYETFADKFRMFIAFSNLYVFYHKKEDTKELRKAILEARLTEKSLLLSGAANFAKKINESKDTALVRLHNEYINQKKHLQQLYKFSLEDLKLNNIDLKAEQQMQADLEKKLAISSSDFKEMVATKIDFQGVKEKLNQGEIAIEIIRSNSDFYGVVYSALVIGKNYTEPKLVFMDSTAYFDTLFVNEYKFNIHSKRKDTKSYNRYFSALESELKGVTKIYFSADGVYQQLNLYTLFNPKTAKYLIEQYEINQITSLNELFYKNEKVSLQNNSALLLGFPEYKTKENSEVKVSENLIASRSAFGDLDELPGTKKETEDINQIFINQNWKSKLYLKSQATEEVVKASNSPTVLHIATHGFFLPKRDYKTEKINGFNAEIASNNALLRSGLILAGASNYHVDSITSKKEDGVLTAYEASILNLSNTELVTLSACETGLGDIVDGQGVYGLQSAFISAGAKNVLMSLWVVDDYATQKLMTEFYTLWINNYGKMTKREALRKAQLSLMAKYPDPYFWGAFVMIGK